MKTLIIACLLLCGVSAQAQYKFAVNDRIIDKGFGKDTVKYIAAYVKLYNITLSTANLPFSLEIHLLNKNGEWLNDTYTNEQVIRQKLQANGKTQQEAIATTDIILKTLVGGNKAQIYAIAVDFAAQYGYTVKDITQQE